MGMWKIRILQIRRREQTTVKNVPRYVCPRAYPQNLGIQIFNLRQIFEHVTYGHGSVFF